MIAIEPYDSRHAQEWDRLVDASRAPSFLLRRGYMDYHADRFADCSLIARRGEGGAPVALLPACAGPGDGTVWSHRGLTYGGWVTAARHVGPDTMMELFEGAADIFRSMGFTTLIYKPIPHIYARYPAEDDLYALFRLGASTHYVMASSAYPLEEPLLSRASTMQAADRARSMGYTVGADDDYATAWRLLTSTLAARHDAAPVHSPAEMTLLAARFPVEIRLFTARDAAGEMQAMTVAYVTPRVVHTQYMATSEAGRRDGALSLLASSLPALTGRTGGWIDFGTSNEDGGLTLNTGLARQKAGLGGRTIAYTAYRLPL